MLFRLKKNHSHFIIGKSSAFILNQINRQNRILFHSYILTKATNMQARYSPQTKKYIRVLAMMFSVV